MIAFFDLDGTITQKDTYLEFIKFCRGKWFYFLGLVFLSPVILLFYLKLYPNDELKALFFTFFRKKYSEKELQEQGDKFSIQKIPKLVHHAAMDRVQWHISKGHKVVVLTASSPIWLAHWCKVNALEIIGTQLEVVNGNYTGRIEGKNCYGEQKKLIVRRILSKNKYTETFGYGDSKGDLPFLGELEHCYYGKIRNIDKIEELKI